MCDLWMVFVFFAYCEMHVLCHFVQVLVHYHHYLCSLRKSGYHETNIMQLLYSTRLVQVGE